MILFGAKGKRAQAEKRAEETADFMSAKAKGSKAAKATKKAAKKPITKPTIKEDDENG